MALVILESELNKLVFLKHLGVAKKLQKYTLDSCQNMLKRGINLIKET